MASLSYVKQCYKRKQDSAGGTVEGTYIRMGAPLGTHSQVRLATRKRHLATCKPHLATRKRHLATCKLRLATCKLHLATCKQYLATCKLPSCLSQIVAADEVRSNAFGYDLHKNKIRFKNEFEIIKEDLLKRPFLKEAESLRIKVC